MFYHSDSSASRVWLCTVAVSCMNLIDGIPTFWKIRELSGNFTVHQEMAFSYNFANETLMI